MIYLLSEQTIETRGCLNSDLGAWENHNLDFGFGYWVVDRSLVKLREQEIDIEILANRETIPIFMEPLDEQYLDRRDEISALCISRTDGSQIRAVSCMQSQGDYRYCLDLQRCFEYSLQAQSKQFWHVIGHRGDLEWLSGHWEGSKKFSAWLSQNRNVMVW